MNHNILQKICDNLQRNYVYQVEIYIPGRFVGNGRYVPSVKLENKLFSKLLDAKNFMKNEYVHNMVLYMEWFEAIEMFEQCGSEWLYNNVKSILINENTTEKEKYETLFEFLFEEYCSCFFGQMDYPKWCHYKLKRRNIN